MKGTLCAVLLAAALGTTPVSGAGQVVDTPVPSTGCARPAPVTPGSTGEGTVRSGGLKRTYTVHVPEDYRAWQPRSLILSYHGHKRTSAYQEELTGMSTSDSIVVYPQGLIGTDGESAWTGAPYSHSADDVLFTSDLLNQLQRQFCVDPMRIHATGKSNGGGFTDVLACRMGGRIAAFAPVSGAYYPQGGPCRPERPVPVLAFHGTADPTIPYAGNLEKGLPTIPNWLAAWSGRNGCAVEPVRRDLGKGVRHERWQSCAGRGAVEHYRIEGLGHDWPSTTPNLDSETPTVIDATPVITRFFARHPLRR